MLSLAFSTLLVVSSVFAHPHFGPNYPRFFDEGRPLDQQPTVNVYKIYAPRLFYMPGYKAKNNNEDNFLSRSKQMIPKSESILDGMMRAEMFPDSLFDEGPNSIYDYDNDFVPAPSNIVSRKLPVYGPHEVSPMMPDYESPRMHLDDFHPAMGNNHHDYMNDSPRMMPEYYDMHGEHCDHHNMIHDFGINRNDDYSDYPSVQFLDPIFMNDMQQPAPYPSPDVGHMHVSPLGSAFPVFASTNEGPLTSFFKKIVTGSPDKNNIGAQLLTTVSFGEPEIINIGEANNNIMSSFLDNERIPSNDVAIIVAEEIDEPENVEETVEEIERNFVKTIFPDNSVVTEEIKGGYLQTSRVETEKEGDIPIEEVEVNIVKTILPDDSYLLSVAGGENEKIQDEVISMIQNSEVTNGDASTDGQLFLSRRLETPEA